MENVNNNKRVRDGDERCDYDESCDVKRLREDLLLDDTLVDSSDLVQESSTNDLASVMKSFEEEINCEITTVNNFVDLTSESGDSQLELGYLLEASDDELGLPPSTASTTTNDDVKPGEDKSVPEYTGFGDFCRFDEFSNFGSQEENFDFSYNGGEYVALDGLFDYPDVYFETESDISWRTETLPAL